MTCDACGSAVPAGSNICSCGRYVLRSGQPMADGDVVVSGGDSAGMALGALMALGGVALSFFTYAMASSGRGGGRYAVFTGLIVVGTIKFFKGLAGGN